MTTIHESLIHAGRVRETGPPDALHCTPQVRKLVGSRLQRSSDTTLKNDVLESGNV